MEEAALPVGVKCDYGTVSKKTLRDWKALGGRGALYENTEDGSVFSLYSIHVEPCYCWVEVIMLRRAGSPLDTTVLDYTPTRMSGQGTFGGRDSWSILWKKLSQGIYKPYTLNF